MGDGGVGNTALQVRINYNGDVCCDVVQVGILLQYSAYDGQVATSYRFGINYNGGAGWGVVQVECLCCGSFWCCFCEVKSVKVMKCNNIVFVDGCGNGLRRRGRLRRRTGRDFVIIFGIWGGLLGRHRDEG